MIVPIREKVKTLTDDRHDCIVKNMKERKKEWVFKHNYYDIEELKSIELDEEILEQCKQYKAKPIKIVVVGDGSVGKTSLRLRFGNMSLDSEDHDVSLVDFITKGVIGDSFSFSLW